MRLSDVSESVPSAELLFTTQSGAIGVVATLSDRYYNFLQKLSLNMTKVRRKQKKEGKERVVNAMC